MRNVVDSRALNIFYATFALSSQSETDRSLIQNTLLVMRYLLRLQLMMMVIAM